MLARRSSSWPPLTSSITMCSFLGASQISCSLTMLVCPSMRFSTSHSPCAARRASVVAQRASGVERGQQGARQATRGTTASEPCLKVLHLVRVQLRLVDRLQGEFLLRAAVFDLPHLRVVWRGSRVSILASRRKLGDRLATCALARRAWARLKKRGRAHLSERPGADQLTNLQEWFVGRERSLQYGHWHLPPKAVRAPGSSPALASRGARRPRLHQACRPAPDRSANWVKATAVRTLARGGRREARGGRACAPSRRTTCASRSGR